MFVEQLLLGVAVALVVDVAAAAVVDIVVGGGGGDDGVVVVVVGGGFFIATRVISRPFDARVWRGALACYAERDTHGRTDGRAGRTNERLARSGDNDIYILRIYAVPYMIPGMYVCILRSM